MNQFPNRGTSDSKQEQEGGDNDPHLDLNYVDIIAPHQTKAAHSVNHRITAALPAGSTITPVPPNLVAFTGQARANRCKHWFSLFHQSKDCEFAPNPATIPHELSPQRTTSHRRFICSQWNEHTV